MEKLLEFIPQIIGTVLVLILAPAAKFLLKKVIKNFAKFTSKSDFRTSHTIKVVQKIVNFVAVICLLAIWGVSSDSMLVVFSSVFAIIGVAMFAQWSLLSNVTAGLIIFFSTPFHIGDWVELMDKDLPITAKIEDIMTFNTFLRTEEGELIVISNSMFLQKTIKFKK